MTPNTEQQIFQTLGRIEGKFEGVEQQLTEIRGLTKRVAKLEASNSKLYGALTILGLLWTFATAYLLKTMK